MKRITLGLLSLVCLFVPIQAQDRIEQWRGKTVMVFTPHPDDDVFGCGGTPALLARNGNKIIVVIYTNDNKGSFDQQTRQPVRAFDQQIPARLGPERFGEAGRISERPRD
jgi:LmbE family N-acetylglucosaminyl deacetylase